MMKNFLAKEVKKEKILLHKWINAKKVALLVSIKPGQFIPLKEVFKIRANLKKKFKDKSFFICLFNNLNWENLLNLQVDFFINFACPRLQDDAEIRQIKNFLNWYEFKQLIKKFNLGS